MRSRSRGCSSREALPRTPARWPSPSGLSAVVAVPYEDEAVGGARRVPRDGHTLQQRVRVAFQYALVVVRPPGRPSSQLHRMYFGGPGERTRKPHFTPVGERRAAPPLRPESVTSLITPGGSISKSALFSPAYPAVRDILQHVCGRDGAGVAQRDPLLGRMPGKLVQVGNTVDRGVARYPSAPGRVRRPTAGSRR